MPLELVKSKWLIANGKKIIKLLQPITSYQLPTTNQGFTLVEILVSLTIIALLTALSIPNLHRFNEDEVLQTETGKIVSVLRQAQSNGQSGVICPVTNSTATDWRVEFAHVTSHTYTLEARCQNDTSTEVKQIFTLPSNITLAVTGTNTVGTIDCLLTPATYAGFSRNATKLNCSEITNLNDLTIKVTNTSITKSKDIMIRKGGSINVQ